MTAAMKKVNKRGPSKSPCLTPMIASIVLSTPSTSNCTITFRCISRSSETSFGGTPYCSSTSHSSPLFGSRRASRGTRSKALTKSIKSTHVSKPCSRRLRISCFSVKIASAQPRSPRKPHCVSWSRWSIDSQMGVSGGSRPPSYSPPPAS